MDNVCRQDTDKVLLVEGNNDCHVVLALCNAHQVPETFGIYQCGSDIGVLKRLNALILRPDPPEVIGVMLDADNPSLLGRWNRVRGKLRGNNHNYAIPDSPEIDGTIVDNVEDKPKLGFWLMPNNQDSGMLEDFCAELAEPDSLLFAQECVEKAHAMQGERVIFFQGKINNKIERAIAEELSDDARRTPAIASPPERSCKTSVCGCGN